MAKHKKSVKLVLRQLKFGIITQNPSFVQLIGLCPLLATTTSFINGVGMGLATAAVLICSNIFMSLTRKIIPSQIRIAAFIVVISGFVTIVEMLMKAYLPDLYDALGVFIALIGVNCLILARAESYASRHGVFMSAVDGLGMGLGFTFALMVVGSIREIIGAGTIMGISVFGENFQPAQIFILPAGAFLTLGIIIALVQRLRVLPIEMYARKYGNDFGGTRG